MASIRPRTLANGAKSYQVRGHGIPTRSFPRQKDALRYKIESERKRLLGAYYEAPPEAFGAFLDAHLDRKTNTGWAPRTEKRQREAARVLNTLRQLSVAQVRRADVEDLIAEVAARAPRQAQMALGLAKQALAGAQARGQAVDQAVFSIPTPAYQGREPRFLTVPELEALSSWITSSVRRIVLVAGMTGMREAELLDLDERQLELDHGVLLVRRGKTAAARRSVVLAQEAVALLREQLLERAPDTRLVFPTVNGHRWNVSNFMAREFRPAAVAAGLGEWADQEEQTGYTGLTFHDLRHTAISLMASAGWQPELIAAQVGHKDGGALIYRRYRHLFPGEREAKLAALSAVLTPTAPERAHIDR